MNIFKKLGEHADLVGGMSEKIGVDWPAVFAKHPELETRYRSAVMTCTHCKKVGECKGWQEGHVHADHAPEYCLNKGLLEDLAAES